MQLIVDSLPGVRVTIAHPLGPWIALEDPTARIVWCQFMRRADRDTTLPMSSRASQFSPRSPRRAIGHSDCASNDAQWCLGKEAAFA